MRERAGLIALLLIALSIAVAVRSYVRTPPNGGGKGKGDAYEKSPLPEPPEADKTLKSVEPSPNIPVGPTPLRVADDAELKTGEFWMEQAFQVVDPSAGKGADGKQDLLELYITVDPQTQAGLRVRAGTGEVVLEQLASKDAAPEVLMSTLPPKFGRGEHLLAAQWRHGELTIWRNDDLLMSWKPNAEQRKIAAGAGALYPPPTPPVDGGRAEQRGYPSGVRVIAANVKLGARRTLAMNSIRFDDDFMRESGDGRWLPWSGRWELTGMAFPERSANAFALRAAFGAETAADDDIYKARRREPEFGLGVMLSDFEGTLHIARISGGSAAARAGLQEDDIFLEVDGMPLESANAQFAHQLITRGYGGTIHLKVLRPGEKKIREFAITPQQYRWATPLEGTPLQPVSSPALLNGDAESMIVTGEKGWSDYAAEVSVKPLGSGGMGLAVAVLSRKDYLLFRWRGPEGRPAQGPEAARAPVRGDGSPIPHDKLELVRVTDGQETILAEKSAGYRPYEFYRMSVDWNGDKIQCLIDGNVMFSATVPGLKRGQVGLCAMQGEPVFFDDVHIAADRSVLASSHAQERKLNDVFVYEDDMEVWANPALEWQRDTNSPWAVHQARFPGEDKVVILNKPKFNDLEVVCYGGTNSEGQKPEAPGNPRLVVKDGKARIVAQNMTCEEVAIGNAPIQRATIRFSQTLGKDYDLSLEADVDGKRIIAKAEPPLRPQPHYNIGDHIAIRGLSNIGDPKAVRVMATNTLEYTFDTAPTDWKVESGRWGLLNKWICDPRWSWFGGRTKTVGALWNKFVFKGDITVDAHVALMMQRDDPPYERPGDYNICLCGDGVNLDSGYTLIFGGDLNSWTRLYKKGKMVAESWNEDHRVFSDKIRHPDKPELHQRWFHLKLEKLGDKISFYRDGNLAFTYTDPQPLPEGRVGFWTLDNGFLLSRVRIAHGGIAPAPFESRRAELFEDARVINTYDGEVFTAVEPQKLPRAIEDALAAPAEAFTPASADPIPQPPPAQKPAHLEAREAPAWRVVNATGGGPFALQWKTIMIDPELHGVVRFAYRIEPGVMVDFYLLDTSGMQSPNFNFRYQGAYRWRMTGPKESNEMAPLVGEIPGVVADGRWHAVQLDLGPSWRALWKSRGFKNASRHFPLRPIFGNLDNHDYLLAGMNGNHAGAAYSVSDIASFTPREAGKGPPQVARVIWPFDDEGDGKSAMVQFETAGSGIREESIELTLNGAHIDEHFLDFDDGRQRLKIDLSAMGLPPLSKLPALTLHIAAYQDRAQNTGKEYDSTYVYDAKQAEAAKKPVAAPLLSVGSGGISDRPLTLAEVAPVEQHNLSRLEDSTDAPPWAPPGQQHSVHIVCTNDGSSFGFRVPSLAYELRRYPFLQLDYKMAPETPANLHFNDPMGQLHALYLTDLGDERDPNSPDVVSHCGPPADFVADGTWRSVTVPLQQLLDTAKTETDVTEISNVSLHDHGWRGTRRSMEYWVHRISPTAAGRSGDLTVAWQAGDVTGIADYASSIDDKPESDPAGKQEIAASESVAVAMQRAGRTLNQGFNYVHLRVKNGAGIWSAPAHRKFFLDSAPPRVLKTDPANGASTPGQTVKIVVDDPDGIDIGSFRMNVRGVPIQYGTPGLTFERRTGTITYNAARAGNEWMDESDVPVEITSLSDRLGNRIMTPYTFTFHTDRSLAAKSAPPSIAKLRFASAMSNARMHRQIDMELSFALDFEQHIGHVHAVRDCKLDWLDDPEKAAFGRRAIQITALQDDGDVQVMLHKNSWYMDNLPLLQFDYKCDPGMKVDLLVEVVGQWHSIRFTGDGTAPDGGKNLGRIEDVIADGTWRHASVDLRSLITAADLDLVVPIVNKLMFSTNGADGVKRGSTLTFDNLDMCPQQGAGGSFEWEPAATAAGVAGYSVAFDQNANTAPAPTINRRNSSMSVDVSSGVWYFHARACDTTGQWGPVRTMRVDFGK